MGIMNLFPNALAVALSRRFEALLSLAFILSLIQFAVACGKNVSGDPAHERQT